jgi:hypothetical protein
MHSFLTEKFGLDFIEINPLYLREMIISFQIMHFETYGIDKSSFEHHIYDIKPYKIELQDL